MEPAKKAAQLLYKKLQCCLQSQQGLDMERRMVTFTFPLSSLNLDPHADRPYSSIYEVFDCLISFSFYTQKKLPLMLLSISMAESVKDFDGDSSFR